MKEILKGQERLSYPEQAALQIAQVQGPWNLRSRNLLKEVVFFGDIGHEGESLFERQALNLVVTAMTSFVGDGSTASAILGKPIVLPERDRGLIVLSRTVLGVLESHKDWEAAALLQASVAKKTPVTEIVKKFTSRLNIFSGVVGKVASKIGGADIVEEFKDVNSKVVSHIMSIYKGSDEELSKNKKALEQVVIGDLESRIGSMNQENLLSLLTKIKSATSDKMVESSLTAARSILAEILESNSKRMDDLRQSLSS